ncbi:MAG: hypothetical protein ACO3JG_11055 [Luteolibacter sp.]
MENKSENRALSGYRRQIDGIGNQIRFIALPAGDENPVGATIHLDEPTSDGIFVFPDAFANGEELARLRPALELE